MYATLNILKNYKNKITSRVKIIGKNTVTAKFRINKAGDNNFVYKIKKKSTVGHRYRTSTHSKILGMADLRASRFF